MKALRKIFRIARHSYKLLTFSEKNITVVSVKVEWLEQGFSTGVRIRDLDKLNLVIWFGLMLTPIVTLLPKLLQKWSKSDSK